MKIDQYAPYIFSSYGIAFLLIGLLAIHTYITYKKRRKEFEELNKNSENNSEQQ